MKSVILSLALLLFVGCSSDTTDESTPVEQSVTVIEMQPQQSYTVSPGDRLEKTSDDAEVSITTNIHDNTTEVILISGTAQIIRAN